MHWFSLCSHLLCLLFARLLLFDFSPHLQASNGKVLSDHLESWQAHDALLKQRPTLKLSKAFSSSVYGSTSEPHNA